MKEKEGKRFWQSLAVIIIEFVIRPIYKWFMHVFTNKSELERILLAPNYIANYNNLSAVEYSLLHSKHSELHDVITSCPVEAVDSAVSLILRVKSVDNKYRQRFVQSLKPALITIISYNQLIRDVEYQRSIAFNSEIQQHEQMILKLWTLAKSETELVNRKTKQWQQLGFQGEDPATDFRGMGILGLDQLIYFFENHLKIAELLLLRSQHPKIGYPFAIAGISFTSLCRDLLCDNILKIHFFNAISDDCIEITDFHDVYCVVFTMFDQVWHDAEPENIMAFNRIKLELINQIKILLNQSSDSVLAIL